MTNKMYLCTFLLLFLCLCASRHSHSSRFQHAAWCYMNCWRMKLDCTLAEGCGRLDNQDDPKINTEELVKARCAESCQLEYESCVDSCLLTREKPRADETFFKPPGKETQEEGSGETHTN